MVEISVGENISKNVEIAMVIFLRMLYDKASAVRFDWA